MKQLFASIGLCFAIVFAGGAAYSENWQVAPEESRIAFGSVKKDSVGETHHFGTISGDVDDTGQVSVVIDLNSVETWIDIRNERMVEHVFGGTPSATISVAIDMTALEGLADGATTTVSAKGSLNFNGANVPVEGDMFVARLSENRVFEGCTPKTRPQF